MKSALAVLMIMAMGFSAWAKEATYNVKGMSCGSCENTLKKKVRAVEGVESVEASFKSGVVKVKMAEGADEKAVATAITSAGYSIKD